MPQPLDDDDTTDRPSTRAARTGRDEAPQDGPQDGQQDGPSAYRPARTLAVLGAMFLMAMSAAGPGFISQTGTFTARYGASFAAAIVASVLIDVAVQLNVWRVVGLSGLRAQDLANRVLPGSGYVLAGLVVVGGVVFCIGNISATGAGLKNLVGLDPRIGASVSAVLCILIFTYRALDGTLDRAVLVLGAIKIGLIVALAVITSPPVGQAALRTVAPVGLDFLPVLTLIGGTVGGYITYAGAHRFLEAGTTGRAHLRTITRGSVNGILVTLVIRVALFLGILGAVAAGATLSRGDPVGSAFAFAAGPVGLALFGLVFWTAGMTSTIGASFTSGTFLKTLSPFVARRFNLSVSVFIAVSTVLYLLLGQTPAALLVFAGAFNGLILPFGLGVMLWIAWRRRDLLEGHRSPVWVLGIGVAAWAFTVVAGVLSLTELPAIFR